MTMCVAVQATSDALQPTRDSETHARRPVDGMRRALFRGTRHQNAGRNPRLRFIDARFAYGTWCAPLFFPFGPTTGPKKQTDTGETTK